MTSTYPNLRDAVEGWLADHEAAIAASQINFESSEGPENWTPRHILVDFHHEPMHARLLVWDHGMADVEVIDAAIGEVVLMRHFEIGDAAGLDEIWQLIREALSE